MSAFSLVEEHHVAAPELASVHFASRLSFETDPSDVYADIEAGTNRFVLLDPRSRSAYEAAHLPGAVSLPHREIDETTTADYPKDTLFVVYCWSPACNAGTKAGLRLSRLGFQVKEMIGGFEYWVREGFPIHGKETANPDLVGRLRVDESELAMVV
jgi:rhodanese-related sulfurtransferase